MSKQEKEVPMQSSRVHLLVLAGIVATIGASARGAAPQGPATKAQILVSDTPSATTAGHTFIAPAGWSLSVKGKATIVEAPEGDSRIVFVDVEAKDPDAAVHEAWAAYLPDMKWPLISKTAASDKDGWTQQHSYSYKTSPNERRRSARGRRGTAMRTWCGSSTCPSRSRRSAAPRCP